MSSLVHCQKVVERMLRDGRTLAEVEEYIDRTALDQMEKAGVMDVGVGAPGPSHTTAPGERDTRAGNQHAHHRRFSKRRPSNAARLGP